MKRVNIKDKKGHYSFFFCKDNHNYRYSRSSAFIFRFDKEPRLEPIKVDGPAGLVDAHSSCGSEARGQFGAEVLQADVVDAVAGDDALVKLQNIERSLLELSQQSLQPQVAWVIQLSFNYRYHG